VDCSRVQQLVSPYLDQQLTGAEMLAVQQHLGECRSCADEYRSARELKQLLGSLRLSRPEASLETRILSRLEQEERRSEMLLPALYPRAGLPAIWLSAPALNIPLPPPSRGRRLGAALALSCLAIFTVAAPFSPSTPELINGTDKAELGQAVVYVSIPSAGLRPASAVGGLWSREAVLSTTGLPPDAAPSNGMAMTSVGQNVPPPLADAGMEPLGDEAVSGYVSGDVALAGYHKR
jgi:anti-sigma factor RsiW